MIGEIEGKSVKETLAKYDLVYHHCRIHGKRVAEGLFILKDIYVSDELIYYMVELEVPYARQGNKHWIITVDESYFKRLENSPIVNVMPLGKAHQVSDNITIPKTTKRICGIKAKGDQNDDW